MNKTILCALMACASVHANDAKGVTSEEANIVKIIDFTGTREQAKAAETIKEDKEINSYLQNLSNDITASAATKNEVIRNSRTLKRAYSYTVRGQQYYALADSKGFEQRGKASWYGPGFHGRKTANGEIYDMHEMTAAHKELPLGSTIEVTNTANGRKVVLRVNDRGPFHGNRVLDLSKAAAESLGILDKGVAEVHIRALK